MDSIVDGFGPIIHGIEIEVDELENMVSGMSLTDSDTSERAQRSLSSVTLADNEKTSYKRPTPNDPEKQDQLSDPIFKEDTGNHPDLNVPCVSWHRKLLSFLSSALLPSSLLLSRLFARSENPKVQAKTQQATGYNTLLRMAASRRLVTSLTRVLAPKNEVVVQIRKRLRTPGGLLWARGVSGSNEVGSSMGLELDVYLGDVQGGSPIVSAQRE